MQKFRKKSVVIEAVQYTGNNLQEIMVFAEDSAREIGEDLLGDYMTIKTLEGKMTAYKDDWIIKGIAGDFYPSNPDIFEQTYELVEE